jgi:hypothetical protein
MVPHFLKDGCLPRVCWHAHSEPNSPSAPRKRKSIGLVADNKGCLEGWLKNMDD